MSTLYDDDTKQDSEEDLFNAHPDIKELDDFDKWEKEMEEGEEEPENTPEDLEDAENNDDDADEDDEDSDEDIPGQAEDDDIPFNPDVKGRVVGIGSFVKKRALIMAALTLISGGGLFGAMLVSGPLQFMHIAKLLQQFHFRTGEDMTDQRFGKFVRYLRDPSRPEKTRLGIIGNNLADRFETKMNKSGISSRYKGSFGSFDGFNIDPNGYENGKFKGKPDQLAEHFKNTYGIDIDLTNPDLPHVPSAGSSFRGNKALMRSMLQEAGYSKVGAAIRARTMGKRAGITWHPIKKLDSALLKKADELAQAIKKRRVDAMEKGAPSPDVKVEAGETTDADGNSQPASGDAAQAASDGQQVKSAADGAPSGAERASRMKGALRKAGTITAVIGITCAIKGIADQIDNLKHDLVVLPLMRLGMEAVTVGNQVMTGQDIQMEQLGVMSQRLYSEQDGSWMDAGSMQYELGQPVTGDGIPAEIAIPSDRNFISEFLGNIPFLGAICDAANSVFGGLIMSAIDFAGGPLAFVVGEVAGTAVIQPLMERAIDWLAGNPVNIEVAGGNYGNYINLGTRLASNENAIAAGGRALSPLESAQLRDYRNQLIAEDQAQKSFAQRVFDVTDPRSIAGNFMMRQTPDPVRNIANIVKSIPTTMASLFSFGMLGQKAMAQGETTFDYGVAEFGFSLDEIDSPDLENPYVVSKEAYDLVNGSNGDSYIEKARNCFGVTINKSDFSVDRGTQTKKYKEIDEDCASKDSNWTKIRMAIFDVSTVDAYSCLEGDSNSCVGLGFNVSTAGSGSGTPGTVTPGDFKPGVEALNCDGYDIINGDTAQIVNGFPTNVAFRNYTPSIKQECETLKTQCINGVSGAAKALCAAFEFDDVYYGNGYSGNTEKIYGFSIQRNALYNPVTWYEGRTPGLNPNNLLECSALATIAVYRAYGRSEKVGSSGSWGSNTHPELFKELTKEEVGPGDFLTLTQTGSGHIAIAAGPIRPDGNVLVYHTNATGTTAHFQLQNYEEHFGEGHRSRWIGPGL